MKQFLEEYNTTLDFNNINYRKGARITSPFGLTQGYRIINNKYIWDSIRIHAGVDRSGHYNTRGGKLKENIVITPFDFNRVEFHDYGLQHVYGSLIRLFNDKYQFEMRIIHMNPKDFSKEFKDIILKNKSIKRNTIIGPAGNYGSASDGAHTHTEFVSLKNTCPLFDSILESQFGLIIKKDYTDIEIFEVYKNASYFKDALPEKVLEHYNELKKVRKIIGTFNRFKYIYRDWFLGSVATRYSSELLFNKL